MTAPFPPGSLLAACIRDSGHEDQELSALHQERSIREWCAKNGYQLTRVFADSRSGKSALKRGEFQAMMAYFRQPAVPEAGVVVWSFSRFARNALEAQYYRAELKRHGKALYSLTEPVPSGPEAIIIEAAYDFAHQKYLDDLSENVATGLRDLVALHGCVPGYPPLGFMRGPKVQTGAHRDGKPRTACRWLPDPEQVPRIRQAFQMRLTGATLGRIHADLHLFGNLNCYYGFFTNKLYIGTLEYADLVIENYCEPVIDRATWDGVQQIQTRFAAHRNFRPASPDHPRRLASAYLLSGLVFCQRCGSPLVGHTSTSKGHTYVSYRCNKGKNHRDCRLRLIPAGPLENEILRHLQEYVLTPDVLAAMLAETLAAFRTRSRSIQPDLSGLRRKLKKLDAQIHNLTRAIAEAGHSAALLDELQSLETVKADLQLELAELERTLAQSDRPAPTLDQIQKLCTTTSERLQHGDIAVRRRILQGLIKQIAVDRDDHGIFGTLQLYAPIPQNDSEVLSISGAPGGDIGYRHTFSIPLHLYERNKTGSH